MDHCEEIIGNREVSKSDKSLCHKLEMPSPSILPAIPVLESSGCSEQLFVAPRITLSTDQDSCSNL
uniref:Uncharacterized protein n=1 Tax=Arundo donax TaxID=35708 RepID=A0A0A9HPE8_ARUDO